MKQFNSVEEERAYYSIRQQSKSYQRSQRIRRGVSKTLNTTYWLLKKFLIIAAVAYGVKNRAEIGRGISGFLSKNQTVQEAMGSIKWLAEELRPPTEAERAQRRAFGEEQRRRAADLRAEGIEPYVKYVSPGDPEWEDAKADWAAVRKELNQGR